MMNWRWFGLRGMTAGGRTHSRFVLFEVSTTTPLAAGEQVFLAGNQEGLGRWKPDGLPLTRMADNLWVGQALCAADEPIEFKVTRGAWASEESLEDGRPPENRVVPPGRTGAVRVTVARWKDDRPVRAPDIEGAYRIHESVHSAFLRFDRKAIVWLPPSYEGATDGRYPVVYLQDGQQLFDPRTSTWGQDWAVDGQGLRLIESGAIGEFIAVGVYSTDDRELEYNPSMAGPAYVRFLAEELKPLIDESYRTRPEAACTAVGGASLGGTLAFHAAWTRPEVFSAAVCLSPAFRWRGERALIDLVRAARPAPAIRLFLSCGMGDPTERELMEGVSEMAALLKERGFGEEGRLTVAEDPDGRHNEAAWAKQTAAWLRFLYAKT